MDIKDICIEVAKKYNINSIGIFGSRARGDFYEESDYDIFIIADITIEKELKIELEIENKIGIEVDVVRLNKNTDRLFLKTVLNEAIVFYDDGEFVKLYKFVEKFFIENGDFLRLRERELIGK